MDNLTHALAGVAVHRVLRSALPGRRSGRPRNAALATEFAAERARWDRALLWTAVAASNLPDADGLYTWISGHTPLGYLLHHRGHTHTFVFAPFTAWAAVALGCLLARVPAHQVLGSVPRALKPWRWQAVRSRLGLAIPKAAAQESRAPWRLRALLFGVALLSACLHVGMDGWNIYGIHPLWPWNPGWFYGDVIFIVEPLLLLTLLPFAFFTSGSKRGRVFWGLALAALELLMWGAGVLTLPVQLAAQGWLAFQLALQWKLRSPLVRASLALAGVALVLGTFATQGLKGRREVAGALREGASGERLVELMLSPGPVNPLCWGVLATTISAEGEWVTRKGFYRAAPAWSALSECGRLQPAEATFKPGPARAAIPAHGRVVWEGEFRWPLKRLRALAREDCGFDALLRFARFPAVQEVEPALRPGTQAMGDLRFDRSPGLDFAEFESFPGAGCPRFVPGWDSRVRRELLAR
ncbi:MAG: metal-dependent hydrolase [Bdellovibrionales bacterium]|nr:metal-dependent hydrolase [Bdellovibrionales bacterium]